MIFMRLGKFSIKSNGLGRALDPCAIVTSLSKLTKINLKLRRTENRSEEKEGMVERLVEMGKGEERG